MQCRVRFMSTISKVRSPWLIILLALLLIFNCTQKVDLAKAKAEIIAADQKFSQLSVKEGTAAAFYHYIANDGRALPRHGEPLTKASYQQLMARTAKRERQGILKWQPIFAEIAASGDLGYTHGCYEYTNQDSLGKEQKSYGYYLTIWKKQTDGSWRFVFDAGNESAPPEAEK